MLQSPQNVTKVTIGYIIWVRGSDVDIYTLYKVHYCHYKIDRNFIQNVYLQYFNIIAHMKKKIHAYIYTYVHTYAERKKSKKIHEIHTPGDH